MAKIIKPSFEILTPIDGTEILKLIEKIARTCYKSEDKITADGESAKKIIATLIKLGHEAMIEHFNITVRFTTDRGMTHELVRHRMASYAQESTRYCNYSKGKFGEELAFIRPCNIKEGTPEYKIWLGCMERIEKDYLAMAKLGCKPDQLRMILPCSIKTEINITANLREWRHILKLRTVKAAHPTIVELMRPLLQEFKRVIPVVFDDITTDEVE